LAIVLWETLGTPAIPDCSTQAILIDVGSVLDPSKFPNRTTWAQAALIWNLYETSDINGTDTLKTAVLSMPFNNLKGDGPVNDATGQFSIPATGFTFDFASQTVTPPLLTFKNNASPSAEQLGELNGIASAALDRMYSFASGE